MRTKVLISAMAALLLLGCSETKYVAEGDYLLDKVKVESDLDYYGIMPADMRQYVRQRGNSRWFSAAKVPLRIYSLSGRDTTKWLNRTLRSIGEPPVIYDTAMTRQSLSAIKMQMQNRGFLRADADVAVKTKGRKLTTIYRLHPGTPYFLRNIRYEIRDSAIAQLLDMDNVANQGLHPGMVFNVDNLDAERKRITQILTDNGYYKFNKDFITYRADSLPGSANIDLTLVLHRYHVGETGDLPHQTYNIRQVRFLSGNAEDSVIHLRPSVLRNNTFIQESVPYKATDLQSTYNHFGRLGAVRYTNIDFRELPDTTLLDCDITVSTNKPSTISFQPEGTNTAGDLGAAASLTYQNRNLFHGSENLSVELRGAFEAIRGLEGYNNSNYVEYSLQTKLSFPSFIAPFLSQSFRRSINATSEVSALYDMQNRPEFRRRVLSLSWRYKWNDPRRQDRFQWDLLDLNYISMPWISDKFEEEYLHNPDHRNSLLLYNYEPLFIMRTGFRYSYSNRQYVVKTNIETGGNLLSLLAHTLHFHKNASDKYTFLDVDFAQYAKADVEVSRYFHFDYRNELVLHAGLGIAYPYGNSTMLPFEKSYFSGGANSLRGWSVRSIGPGSYVSEDGNIDFFMQTGDVKLDLNMEYRAHLFWKLDGALFVDAGNIWTLRDYEDRPGGQLRLSDFLDQLAASYGLGFRFNFDYFILRFDMGMKAVNPVHTNAKEHFPIIHPRLSRDFAFHFAVGMPF